MLRFWHILSFTYLIITFIHGLPQTLPTPVSKAPICNPISECTPEWFLKETKPEYAHTLMDRALFYTFHGSNAARKLSCDPANFFVSIWQIWPDYMYDEKDPRLKHVYSTEKIKLQYYGAMSTAFARMARGAATSLHTPKDYVNPPTEGIFGRHEIPALGNYTDIDKLWAIMLPRGDVSAAWLDSALAGAGMYYGPAHWQSAPNVVQKNMWSTEYVFEQRRQGFVDGGHIAVGPTCPYVTDKMHPLIIGMGGTGQ